MAGLLIAIAAGRHCLLRGALLRLLLFAIFLDGDAFTFRGDLRPRKILYELGVAHFQSGEILEARLGGGIVERIWIELRIDPFCEADFADVLDITRPWSVAEAVESVKDGFSFV